MANICLADLWKTKALKLGWPERAACQLPLAWAQSTLRLYDRLATRFVALCSDPRDATHGDVAVFLCTLADTSDRPQSQLKSATAAINCLYGALDMPSPAVHPEIEKLSCALVKSGTVAPAVRTSVMPIQAFHDLFMSWADNEELSVQDLRLKAITLMALTFMARPSDLAPNAVHFDPTSLSVEKQVLSTSNIVFHGDGSMTVRFFGIKNDSTRTGFECTVPQADNAKIDPCKCLKSYIDRTRNSRPADTLPVFISLRAPFKAISSSSIAQILGQAISLSGLAGRGFSAKNFRPTSATAAVAAKVPVETAMQLGRWKTREVFLNHYVFPSAPKDYTTDILSGCFD